MAPSATSDLSSASLPNPVKQMTPLEAMAHRGNALPKIPTFTSFEAHRQWQLEHMAGAFRVFARHGYAEGISGHISVRDPEFADRFWINPLGEHFGVIKASDMVCVDLEGNPVAGNKVGELRLKNNSIQ